MPVDWVEGSYNPLEQPFPSTKLTVAEILYEEFDKRVDAISRILKGYGRYLQHIQHTERPSKGKLAISTIIASCFPFDP